MSTLTISLPEAMVEFVEAQAREGGFVTVSEYVEAVLRDVQVRAAKRALEEKLREGIESGDAAPLTHEEWDAIVREGFARAPSRRREPA